MKRFVVTVVVAAAASFLCACTGLTTLLTAPAGRDSTMGQAVLQHLELCRRTYRGALGAGVTGSFEIECPAQPAPASASRSLEVGAKPGSYAPAWSPRRARPQLWGLDAAARCGADIVVRGT